MHASNGHNKEMKSAITGQLREQILSRRQPTVRLAGMHIYQGIHATRNFTSRVPAIWTPIATTAIAYLYYKWSPSTIDYRTTYQ